jgi:hypothetical protein
MANVFVVEWVEKKQAVRQKVEFGNFDGNIQDAQRVIDNLWPYAFPGRTNVKVVSIVGAGEVVKVKLPEEAPDNAATARNPTIAVK